jgi:hypothetical protein
VKHDSYSYGKRVVQLHTSEENIDALWLQGRRANFYVLWNSGYILVYLCSVVALKERSNGLGKYFSKLSILFVAIESYAQLKRISRFERHIIIIIIIIMYFIFSPVNANFNFSWNYY